MPKSEMYYYDGTNFVPWTGTTGGTTTTQAARATATSSTAIAGTTASGTALALNANRLGAALYNDSTALCYVNLGTAAASNSSKTIAMAGSAYYEVPFGYTGVITLAMSASSGTVYVTQFS